MSGFEIRSGNTVRIGESEFRSFTHEPPLQGKWRYTMEAAGSDDHRPWPKLSPYQLNEVSPSDLPNGTSISIFQPQSNMRDLCYLVISKLDDESSITVTVNFNFRDWHFPFSMPEFLAKYREILLGESAATKSVQIHPTGYGIDIECELGVGSGENFHTAYDRSCEYLLNSYRGALAFYFSNQQPPSNRPVEANTDTHGMRWWLRYIAVPLLGSGTAVALIAGALALLR